MLDKLLADGNYKNYSEVITLAIANLSVLQNRLAAHGELVIGAEPTLRRNVSPAAPSQSGGPEARFSRNRTIGRKGKSNPIHKRFVKRAATVDVPPVPKLFNRIDVPDSLPTVAPLPDLPDSRDKPVPLERWLFGQYNKLLPAKAACRAIANLLLERGEPIPALEAAGTISEQAVLLGDYLWAYDNRHRLKRDAAVSLAFPKSQGDVAKSKMRFANQFVVSGGKGNRLIGLPAELRLLGQVGTDSRIALTEPGWEFAALPNTVLDGYDTDVGTKLTAQETSLLIGHIMRNIQVEDFAYRTILRAILEGATTPGLLDSTLERWLPPVSDSAPSRSFLSSQRSGAVSRMVDLGLVQRIREGLHVSYEVTGAGKGYLGRA